MSATKYEVNISVDQNELIVLPGIKTEKLHCEMIADVGQELVVSLPRIKIEDLGPYINGETNRRNLKSSSWPSQGENQEATNLHICNICVYNARCKCDLTRHMFWHKDPLNPKMLRCPFCEYRNNEHTNNFQRHLLSHRTFYSKWKCSICHYLSISVQDLGNHLFVHKDPSDLNLFHCPFCQYKTKELTNLNSHMRLHETMLKCCVCEEECLNKNDLTKHIVKHRDPNDSCRYKCDLCDHKSKYLSSFRLHYVTHKDLIDAITCCICNYRCKPKEDLEGHMLLHKDTVDDVFKCYLCNHNTQHLEDLKIHLSMHSMFADDQKTVYPCICSNKCANKYANHHVNSQRKTSHCDARYSSKFSLKLQMQDHVDPKEKCKICDAQINKSDLKKHKEIFHSRNINDFNQIFECSLCDYQCETQSDLAKHLLIHKDSVCSLCPFKTEKELFWISHMLLHSNKKKEWYHCSQCPYRTVVLKHLKGHEDTHKDRSERNLFECSHCHSKYTNKFSLKLHMQDHLDPSEKVIYQCDHCDYKTKLKSILKKHKLKHRLVKCGACDLEMNEFDRKRHNEIFHCESDSKKSHKCCICHCKFETKSDLAKHLLAHKDLGNRCTLCKYKTRTKDELSWISHMLLHSNEDEAMKYQCDLCTFRTAKLSRLKHHKEIHKNRSERNLFRCEQCGAEYAAKKSFKAHMAAHGEGLEMVTHYCDQCDFKTLIKSSMRRHKQGHRIQKCGFCNLEMHENDLKIHEIFHSENAEDTIEAFKCCICNCTSKTKGSFAEHLLSHKNTNNICDLCGYKSNKEVAWVSHMFVHSNVNIIKCDRKINDRFYMRTQDQSGGCGFCNLKIENKLELKKHVENFHPEKLKAFGVCCLCDSRFESKEDLAKHFFLHKDPTNCGLFMCDKCNYKTKYLNCLKLHRNYGNCDLGIDRSKNIVNQIEVKEVGSGEELKLKIEESHCSEPEIPNMMNRSSLNDHIRSEHPSNLKCCICEHKIITKLDLSKHMLLHKDSKSFKCDLCNHKTRYLYHFKLHLRKHKPAGDKKYRCDVCPFEAPYISRMKLHKEVHKDPSERKYFRCLLCDHRYMTKAALKMHMLQHENPSAVKMFYCDTCDFKTMYKVSLNDHKLHRHTKMERFKCDFCGKKMKRKAALVRHTRTFHSGT